MPIESVAEKLKDPSRPTFLFGTVPPKEGTSEENARAICAMFAARSAVLATDGFIVYDIQEEGGRTNMERPFPFRKTMDPSLYASFFLPVSGKPCVVYKSVVESDSKSFDAWLEKASKQHQHEAFNFVGAPTSGVAFTGPTLPEAMRRAKNMNLSFGCVSIAERHMKKGTEDRNMLSKIDNGAEWFITQGVYEAAPTIKLVNDYSAACKVKGIIPKKVVLTFAPCGRKKTMTFIKWLGMQVSPETEERIFSAADPVGESIELLSGVLKTILEGTGGSGVPIGINVESLSIFKEEIDAAHVLFQKLQALLLDSRGSPWAVRWFLVAPALELSEKKREREEEIVARLFNHREQNIIKHITAHRNRLSFLVFDQYYMLGVTLAGIAGLVVGRYALPFAGNFRQNK